MEPQHIFRKPIKKRSRNKTTGYFEWSLDGNLCFRALFKKIGSVGTPSRFSFLFFRTLCFYSALETISFFRKSGQGGCETAREPNSLCNSSSVEVIQDVGCNHPAVHTHSRKVNAYYFFVTSLAAILDILSRDRLWEKRIPSEGELKDVPRPLPSCLLHPHFWKLSRLRTWGCYFWWKRSKRQLFYSLRWLINVFNPVVNTKLPAILSHRRSTTVSLETYPLIQKVGWFSPTGLLRTAELGAPCKKNGQSQVTQKEQQIAGHAKRTANCRSRKKNSRL